jgi:hypothetical protein
MERYGSLCGKSCNEPSSGRSVGLRLALHEQDRDLIILDPTGGDDVRGREVRARVLN